MTISVFPKEPISRKPCECPIALALLARGIKASVSYTRVDVDHFGKWERIALPLSAQDFVRAIDRYLYSDGPMPEPFILHLPVQ